MENNTTPNADFENYLRKNLEQIDASPDEDVWAKIAGKQAQPNKWRKFRRYGMYAAGALLIAFSGLGIWHNQHRNFHPNEQKTTPEQMQVQSIETSQNGEVAGLEAMSSDNRAEGKNGKKHAYVPNFSSRVNSVPASSIRFNAETGLRYQSPTTGTSVNIPANSLVDETGQAVHGEAELFFREYRTIGEFLASGIPMHYGDDRGQYSFNSGGMFEVRVSQAGSALKMGAGKTYDVEFSPTAELEGASLYYLDDQTKTWKFKPEAAFGQSGLSQPPIVSEATAVNNNLRGQSDECLPALGELVGEPDPADLVKTGVKTGFDLATKKLEMPTWFKKNPSLTDEQLLFRLERGLIQIKRHRDQRQLFFPEDLNKYFTELAAFKDCYFTFNMETAKGNKNGKKLGLNDYWQRFTVAHKGGANCVVTLYDGKEGQLQFHAVLTGSTENKTFNAEQVLAQYDSLRQARQQDFSRKNDALRYFLHAASAFKTKEEWCYSDVQWLEYFENNHPLMARRYAALIKDGLTTNDALAEETWKNWGKMLRETLRNARFSDQRRVRRGSVINQAKDNLQYALKLNDFGIYNCDQIFRFGNERTQFVNTTYKTTTGTPIIPAFVSIMEKSTRIFMTLPSLNKMIDSEGRKIDVIVTDRAGRQYLFPAEKYATQKFDKMGVTVLTLNDVTDQTESPRAWADLLDI